MFLLKTLTLSSMLLLMSMSPIMVVIAILILSSSMMLIKWLENYSPWIPLIFTLAFLGGMMIIFMYIISISTTKNKKNKNKLPTVFVFVSLSLWTLKYGYSANMTHIFMSSYFSQYSILCSLIVLILFISTKVINSPFKALKSSF